MVVRATALFLNDFGDESDDESSIRMASNAIE